MGVVFMAEQTEPVHRNVALKLIKSGMDNSQVLARFEAERQALALMDHPNIAKVLDAALVLQALEELKMLALTGQERERYEARRKAQLDYNTGLKAARMEGRAEGEIGRIHLCERLLKRPLTPTEQLTSRSLEDLIQLANELQAQVVKE
jgi:hypothetical protein